MSGKFWGFPDSNHENWGAHINRTQRELVTKLSESLTVDNKPASPELMEKMKDLFN
jgi:hypothetical protein